MWFWNSIKELPYGYEIHEVIYEYTITLAICMIKGVAVYKDNSLAYRLRRLANLYDTRPRETP